MKKAAFLVLAALALAAPAFGQQAKVLGDETRGEALVRRWCVSCHLIEGRGPASDLAPPFHAVARDPRKTPDYLRTFLANPHAPMPPLQLSRAEIEDIVAYLGTLRAR